MHGFRATHGSIHISMQGTHEHFRAETQTSFRLAEQKLEIEYVLLVHVRFDRRHDSVTRPDLSFCAVAPMVSPAGAGLYRAVWGLGYFAASIPKLKVTYGGNPVLDSPFTCATAY